MDEAMDILNVATDAIAILLLAIALISLVVGGVGIMNVMFVAVSERTNEIGLKKAVGARPSAIKSQFMGEAIIIAVVGGIIGIIVGVALSWLMSFGAQLAGYNWKFVITINGLLFAFLIPAGIGIMFGYAPAKRASKMNPIDALKHT
jgi:putative ABC transport system permease protein